MLVIFTFSKFILTPRGRRRVTRWIPSTFFRPTPCISLRLLRSARDCGAAGSFASTSWFSRLSCYQMLEFMDLDMFEIHTSFMASTSLALMVIWFEDSARFDTFWGRCACCAALGHENYTPQPFDRHVYHVSNSSTRRVIRSIATRAISGSTARISVATVRTSTSVAHV